MAFILNTIEFCETRITVILVSQIQKSLKKRSFPMEEKKRMKKITAFDFLGVHQDMYGGGGTQYGAFAVLPYVAFHVRLPVLLRALLPALERKLTFAGRLRLSNCWWSLRSSES
jgi:hypothetical protein